MKQEKKLNANVDFYSASTYTTLGIDIDLFTPDLRRQPHRRLGRSRDRTARRQPPHPPARGLHRPRLSSALRPRGPTLSTGRFTLAPSTRPVILLPLPQDQKPSISKLTIQKSAALAPLLC